MEEEMAMIMVQVVVVVVTTTIETTALVICSIKSIEKEWRGVCC
jgi:hypothetical protein